MNSTYGALAHFAKELAEQGFAVLRYHPYGTGDSDGSLAEFSLQSACADAATAAQCLRERTAVQSMGFLGLRFGGSVAVHAAEATRPDFLLLWSPIVNLRHYGRELLRLRLTKELVHQRYDEVKVTTQTMIEELESGRVVDIMGYDLSAEFYRQMTAHPTWPDRVPALNVLWLARPREQGQAAPILDNWRSRSCQVDMEVFSEPAFWEDFFMSPRRFMSASRQWLGRGRVQ
jgi:alpha/beta superfamily hydrolase